MCSEQRELINQDLLTVHWCSETKNPKEEAEESMCGLGGVVARDSVARSQQQLKFRSKLEHRGPDGYGQFSRKVDDWIVYGEHHRLSIVDLDDRAAQPMTCLGGCHVVLFNGEIYNHKDLRDRLPRGTKANLVTNSDTEVLLESWCISGDEILDKLEGMFAFAVWDENTSTITLSRDRFGIKPLFYEFSEQSFAFASEARALSHYESASENQGEVGRFLFEDRYLRSEETFLQGILSIRPGEVAQVSLNDRGLTMNRYLWTDDAPALGELRQCGSVGRLAKEVRAAFLESVRLHMLGDVPVAFALSGGLDSSAIVCAARHLFPTSEIHTFSYIGSDDAVSEERYIDLVNKKIGAVPHKVFLDSVDRKIQFSNHIRAQGFPTNNPHFFAQYLVFAEASNAGFKVVIEGQGADEVLGGYNGYLASKYLSIRAEFDLLSSLRIIFGWKRMGLTSATNLAGSIIIRALEPTIPISKWIFAMEGLKSGLGLRAAISYLSTKKDGAVINTVKPRKLNEELEFSSTVSPLPRILLHGDHNAMSHGVENRVPFLSPTFAKFMLSLSHQNLVSNKGVTKKIFRDAMRGIVPDEILNRSDKVGFSAEINQILSLGGQQTSKRKLNLIQIRSKLLFIWRSSREQDEN